MDQFPGSTSVSYLSSDMLAVYNNPNIDVIVLRPLETATYTQACPEGGWGYWWEGPDPEHLIDYGEVAEQLYQSLGDLPKTIILTGWESDWQLRALSCGDMPTAQQVQQFSDILIARQQGVAAARAAHPDAELRVYHAIEVNHVLGFYPYEVVKDLLPNLTIQPDFISFSSYESQRPGATMTDALNYIETYTGFPRSRIFIGELGWEEDPDGTQLANLYPAFSDAFDWGVRMVFKWMYRQKWGEHAEDNMGIWARDESGAFTGGLTSGYLALAKLRGENEDCTNGACASLPWECGTGIWCNMPFQCGEENFCGQTVEYGQCASLATCTDFRCVCPGSSHKWRSDQYGQAPFAPSDQPPPPACLGDESCFYSDGTYATTGTTIDNNSWICSWAQIDGRRQGVWYQCEQSRATAGSIIEGFTCLQDDGNFEWTRAAGIFADDFETGNCLRWSTSTGCQ